LRSVVLAIKINLLRQLCVVAVSRVFVVFPLAARVSFIYLSLSLSLVPSAQRALTLFDQAKEMRGWRGGVQINYAHCAANKCQMMTASLNL
jgi:hypothetical protein